MGSDRSDRDEQETTDRPEKESEPSLSETFAHRMIGESGWFRSFLADLGMLILVFIVILITVSRPGAYPEFIQWAYLVMLAFFFALPFVVFSQVLRHRETGLSVSEWTSSFVAAGLLLHFIYVNSAGGAPYNDSYVLKALVFVLFGVAILFGSWKTGGTFWKNLTGKKKASLPWPAIVSIPVGFIMGVYFLFVAFFQNFLPGMGS